MAAAPSGFGRTAISFAILRRRHCEAAAEAAVEIGQIAEAASKAAQSGPVEVVTTDANGNLASASIDSLMMNSELGKRIGENTEGVAMAIAMGGTYLPQPGETFRLSGNWGSFEGENALAFSGAYALGQKTFLTAGFGAGLNEGTFGGRAGVSFGW